MPGKKINDFDLQALIGNLLRYGIWTALSVAAIGGVIYLFRHGHEITHYGNFVEREEDLFSLFSDAWTGALQGKGQSIILMGIFLLFSTPVLRLIFSLIAFLFERDYLYVVISLIVIGIICFSVFYGFAH